MAIEVDYITLGDVASRLKVPAPTLRHWTDQMEEFKVHYVLRNNRNERIYEETDIKVFEYLRDLKEEYGRRTTTRDLGYMIAEKGESGDLKLRTREDAPPPPSNRTTDLLNQEDIKRVLESDRARQVIGYLVGEATKNMKDDLIEEVRETVRSEMVEYDSSAIKALEEIEERRAKREEERHLEQLEFLKKIEASAKEREDRDRQERIKWQKEQEQARIPEPEKPKTWLQKLLGQ
jgi:hypothetical protein